mmetsp:Transcript_103124/g.298320  ORF Transcript_103124/g.298320 Transcript_103124/m.298320 type:complete len:342 (+) Transcript_103124:2050-3075(+)
MHKSRAMLVEEGGGLRQNVAAPTEKTDGVVCGELPHLDNAFRRLLVSTRDACGHRGLLLLHRGTDRPTHRRPRRDEHLQVRVLLQDRGEPMDECLAALLVQAMAPVQNEQAVPGQGEALIEKGLVVHLPCRGRGGRAATGGGRRVALLGALLLEEAPEGPIQSDDPAQVVHVDVVDAFGEQVPLPDIVGDEACQSPLAAPRRTNDLHEPLVTDRPQHLPQLHLPDDREVQAGPWELHRRTGRGAVCRWTPRLRGEEHRRMVRALWQQHKLLRFLFRRRFLPCCVQALIVVDKPLRMPERALDGVADQQRVAQALDEHPRADVQHRLGTLDRDYVRHAGVDE